MAVPVAVAAGRCVGVTYEGLDSLACIADCVLLRRFLSRPCPPLLAGPTGVADDSAPDSGPVMSLSPSTTEPLPPPTPPLPPPCPCPRPK